MRENNGSESITGNSEKIEKYVGHGSVENIPNRHKDGHHGVSYKLLDRDRGQEKQKMFEKNKSMKLEVK